MRLWIHDDITLPHVVREATMLVTFHDVLYWDIPASYTSSGGHPHDGTGTGFAFSAIGDVVALFEVRIWGQGPVQVLKLFIKCGHDGYSLSSTRLGVKSLKSYGGSSAGTCTRSER